MAVGRSVCVVPFASTWPDGLDRFAEPAGFSHREIIHRAPIADYRFPGIDPAHSHIATALAGLVGTLIALGVALALAKAGKLKTYPFTERAKLLQMAEPVKQAYAKEVDALPILNRGNAIK